MSGLLALLDDVAAIAKVAAASVDDVIGQAAKAGAKAAGAVIDDAAVTPKYVTGFKAARELPIVWRIAKGSLKNKLLFLLPAGLLLNTFAPWSITPLLMLGGAYLCFEGAEKVYHLFVPHHHDVDIPENLVENPTHLEEQKVSGAIKTDFILSAEIMTIALAEIPDSNIWMEASTLAVVAIGITVMVYGSVALIVKADDVGLHMSRESDFSVIRSLGRGIVKAMPGFLKILMTIGTAAMLWVGGSIIIHGFDVLGMGTLYGIIHDIAYAIAHAVGQFEGVIKWVVTAALDGVFGLALGLALIPLAAKVILPIWNNLRPKPSPPSEH
ncbi:Inner membrane protein YedI [Roseibium album]|nr:Inner membrane protein YedI [Roseibium album]